MSDQILVECSDSIARVTLNRADKLNCVTIAMWRELKTLFESFDADDFRIGTEAFMNMSKPEFTGH